MIASVLLGLFALYLAGWFFDDCTGKNYCIGGILPFAGFRTIVFDDAEVRGISAAWLGKAILLSGTIKDRT